MGAKGELFQIILMKQDLCAPFHRIVFGSVHKLVIDIQSKEFPKRADTDEFCPCTGVPDEDLMTAFCIIIYFEEGIVFRLRHCLCGNRFR